MRIESQQKNIKMMNSGIQWLGDVPADWKILPVRSILQERKEKNKDGNTENILSVMKDIGVIRYEDKGNVGNKSSDRPESYKVVYEKDIVINSMNLTIGSVGIANEPGVTSSVYIIYFLKNSKNDIRYFYDLFRDKSFQKHLGTFGKGIMELRESIKHQDIKVQLIPIPPAETQERIVNFLDEKTKNIDNVIKRKQKLIELLKKKRISLITKIVTEGIDQKSEKKLSSVDFFGEIPKTWKEKKLKFVAEVLASNIDKHSYDGEKEVLLCNYVDVYNNEIICDNLDFMRATASIDQIKKLKLKKGYVIITKDSETADDIGVPAFVQECADNLVCGYHLYLIKNDAEIVGKFLFRLLQAKPYRSMFELKANGVTRFGLGSYGVKNIKIPIPPLDVQEKIIDTIDKKVDSIDKAILNIKKQIEKLKEYRASLIYNAVTGKIKI